MKKVVIILWGYFLTEIAFSSIITAQPYLNLITSMTGDESGVYFARFVAGDFIKTKKLVLMR